MPTAKTGMATDRDQERTVRADKETPTTENPIIATATTENRDKATSPVITTITTATETSARM
jgi:hypothetical protein